MAESEYDLASSIGSVATLTPPSPPAWRVLAARVTFLRGQPRRATIASTLFRDKLRELRDA